MWPGFDSRTRRHMWVEFVVGSRPCSERFFSGYSGFPLSSKTNISKFQFDLDYCQALYHEPLAREIAQALPVLLSLNLNLNLKNLVVAYDLAEKYLVFWKSGRSREVVAYERWSQGEVRLYSDIRIATN